MVKPVFSIIALAVLLAATAQAEDFVVEVNGMVCEFCALGVAKKIRKLSFIDKTKLDKGVRVDIENQKVYLAVNDDDGIDHDALFKAIESGGYKPVALFRIGADGERVEVKQ